MIGLDCQYTANNFLDENRKKYVNFSYNDLPMTKFVI